MLHELPLPALAGVLALLDDPSLAHAGAACRQLRDAVAAADHLVWRPRCARLGADDLAPWAAEGVPRYYRCRAGCVHARTWRMCRHACIRHEEL